MTKKTALPNFADEIRNLVGEGRAIPPVAQWQPEREGKIDIRIDRDGNWYYEGEPMQRESVVQLFATIMRKDGDAYYLVTPAEKLRIQVDLLPFVIRLIGVEGEGKEQKIFCSSNVGDHFCIGAENPLMINKLGSGDVVPSVKIRAELDALLLRSVYYELAEYAVELASGEDQYGIWSDGVFFPM